MRSFINLCIRAATVSLLTLLAVSVSVAQSAASSEKQAQRAVALRQSLFRMINYGYAPLGDMLKGRAPFDARKVQDSARLLVVLAPIVDDAFRTDTRQFRLKTWASDDIWTRKADFLAKNGAFVKAAEALAGAAAGGDRKAVLERAAEIGRACSACHDDYTR